MTSDFHKKIAVLREALVEPAALLFAVQRISGDEVRKKTMNAYGRLLDAHLLLTGVIGSALMRVNGKFTETDQTSEQRNALFASFVIGLEVCEEAIAEGRYLQAHALLRQEMETVAQLISIQFGRRKEGQQANVAVLEKSLARLYGDLSAASHVAKHYMVRSATELDLADIDLPGPTSGTRYFPAFNDGVARRSFGLHLILILHVAKQMSVDHSNRYREEDQFSERDNEAVNLALLIMQAEGIVEID